MLTLGLTGGIASGKSTASYSFAHLGAVVIDYDVLARDAVAPGSPGLAAVVRRFGPGMLMADGSLNRPALAALVFDDDEALEALEDITHPEVWRLASLRQQEVERAPREVHDPEPVVVHDVPLLVESGMTGAFDLVVVVNTPAEIRLQRMMESRGYTRAEAKARIAAQASDAARLQVADRVLDGSGTPENLERQVDALWRELTTWD
ncbi:MAG: dephospho-CoA kinase [Cellulomonadaceae bacterium]|jgi:dephospho-CoA kinase|nr:dephospho-CoA kinase [Cellulomonadaceae bacterium]